MIPFETYLGGSPAGGPYCLTAMRPTRGGGLTLDPTQVSIPEIPGVLVVGAL